MWLHAHWLERAPETVLEEAGDPFELFLVDDCEDQLVSDVVSKVLVEIASLFRLLDEQFISTSSHSQLRLFYTALRLLLRTFDSASIYFDSPISS